ncbi:hypothetical protein PG997_011161 [Apiospora hydei]|uniref:DUF7728 domain-containing protein n=1 Tax=Apiospora hydei TaxID=1337664 RepID=A0ABR1VID2_9PEZI
MHLSSLLTAAGLAVSSTNAFLLPLSESSDNDAITTLPVPINAERVPQISEKRTLKLDCPGCSALAPGRHHAMSKLAAADIPSYLELDFSVDHAANSDRLLLNGFELYPNSDPMASTLSAKLQNDAMPHHRMMRPGHMRHNKNEFPLGFGLRTAAVAKNEEDNMELYQLDLQIIEVGNVFIDGLPNVQVKVIKTPEGGLMIGNVDVTASESGQKGKPETCTSWVCRMKAAAMQQLARLRTFKSCHGKPKAMGKLEGMHRHPGPHHLNDAPQPPRPMEPAHEEHCLAHPAAHCHRNRCCLGMMVGTAIVCLWRTFVRPAGTRRHHRRRGHSVHKAAHNETAASDEKAGLMSHQEEVDTPPSYVEEGLVEDKKPNSS